MPKTRTVDDITTDREALEKSLKTAETEAKKAKGALDKVFKDYDTVRSALLEGIEEIEEIKARARAEVKAAVDTWTKMEAKLDGIMGKVKATGKDVTGVLGDVGSVNTAAAALKKELTKVGGDIKAMRDENEELKKLESSAERMRFELADLEGQVKELRDAPPKPNANF